MNINIFNYTINISYNNALSIRQRIISLLFGFGLLFIFLLYLGITIQTYVISMVCSIVIIHLLKLYFEYKNIVRKRKKL